MNPIAAASTVSATPAGPRACIIGWPVAQSRSPLIHGYWLNVHGLKGSYEPVPVAPDNIASFLQGFTDSGYVGGNVTVPHKQAAFAAVAEADPVARALQAVNTLWIDGGRLYGGNTDALGFLANLDQNAPGWDKSPGPALVLGAGGAARAVVWALLDRGFRVRIVNRTRARADELADHFGGDSVAADWSDIPKLLSDAKLLVNTTSLGMTGKDALAIDLATLSPDTLVTDIVYVPLVTPLLAAARARGLRTVDGLGMLLHQAAPGFERWFGVRPAVTDALRALILADIARTS